MLEKIKALQYFLGIGLCLIFFTGQLNAQNTNDLLWKDKIDQTINEYFIEDGPGGLISISKDGENLYLKSFGYANIEKKDTITNNTLFDIASCSKQFTAASVMTLADKNLIDLNKPIQFYLPEFIIEEPIPIYSLLTHCSGLQDYSEITLLARGREGQDIYTKEELLDIIYNQKNLAFLPITSENYSNTNYAILAELVEKVSHQSFPEFVTKQLLQPLNISISEITFSNQVQNSNIAIGYLNRERKEDEFVTDFSKDNTQDKLYGAGGMYANVQGLQKWMTNYSKNLYSNKSLIDNLLHRDTLANGALTKYARGIETGYTKSGYKWIQHTGRSSSTSIILWLPDFNITIIGLFNTQEIWSQSVINKFLKDIIDYYEKEEGKTEETTQSSNENNSESIPAKNTIAPQPEIELPIAHLEKFTGTYPAGAPVGSVTPPSGGVGVDKIVLKDEKLQYVLYNGYEINLKPINDTILEMIGVGRPIQLHFNNLNQKNKYITVADPFVNNGEMSKELTFEIPVLSINELQKFTGAYQVPNLPRAIPIKILLEGNNLYMQWGILNKRSKLYYLGDDIFSSWQSGNNAMQCNLIFTRDKEGKINGFKYDGHRAWNLQFYKID